MLVNVFTGVILLVEFSIHRLENCNQGFSLIKNRENHLKLQEKPAVLLLSLTIFLQQINKLNNNAKVFH